MRKPSIYRGFTGEHGNVEDNVCITVEIIHYMDFIQLWKNNAPVYCLCSSNSMEL